VSEVQHQPKSRVRVWDLPTRLFHWTFAALIVLAWLSGEFAGSDWRHWHMRFGYAALALLLFRLLWGFAGPRYALFASFPPSLRAVFRQLHAPRDVAGHAPLGALSVYALLASVAVQVVTGMMSSDDFNEGPWLQFVSERTGSLMGSVHAVNRWVLLALVALHLAAIAWYALRGKPLLRAMLTGDRNDLPGLDAAEDDRRTRLRALVLALLATALAAVLATL